MGRSRVTFSGSLYDNRHTFQIAGDRLTKKAKTVVREVANLYLQSLHETIDIQGPGWDTSTVYYQRKKQYFLNKHGLKDQGPWVKTGQLISQLGVFETQDGLRRFRAYAGFKDGPHESGYSIAQLVDILDARRPLISPSWERIKDHVDSLARDAKWRNNLL